ncbi:MAG: purine-binding chemotaxis protein CheW [Methanothermococcus sp.]|jgi:purine-binding chemotaxis protein CheW|uniref:chemotaxis protein CheW n=1 Tax=Methanothermococcus TaxID=155862 RepID=UPI0003619696|nr:MULTISPECIES: chemotaxis protein CheW [Methanothermococcus]MDK2790554.1 purine-binding chemotaxis protein CheW [Methanothermococcus sp.]MDK2988109.1 purine-binding chemotaxis protein CheW [Methanothermococcus sp.]
MEEIPKVVVFKLSSNEYGLRVDEVREVLKVQDITSLPNTPDYIIGVTNIRGEITPIIDLRKKLNIYDTEEDNENEKLVMVIEIDNVPVGILVDAVSDVMQISKEQIEDMGEMRKNISGEYIEGIAKINNRLIIILNIKNLVNPQEL